MFRKPIVHLVIGTLLVSFIGVPSIIAQTNKVTESERVAQLKTKLAKLGTGKKTRVEIKLSDNTKRTGYLSQVNENSFVLTDVKTGQNTEFTFVNIADAKKSGKPAWVKLAIAGVIVIAVVVTFSVLCGNPDYGCE